MFGIADNTWILGLIRHFNFNDRRLALRFGLILENLIKLPQSSIPEASGSWASAKGTYRFFGNKKVRADEIRDGFARYTSAQIEDQKMVIIANDTYELTYGSNRKTRVGGYVLTPGTNGVFVHSAMVISQAGVPLGFIFQKHWVRKDEQFGKRKKRAQRDIEDKESYCWLETLDAVEKNVPTSVTALVVGDRGSDIYELFAKKRSSNIHLLVRAAYNRTIDDEQHSHLFDAVNAQPVEGTITVTIRAKNKKNREATVEIRYKIVNLRKPSRLGRGYPASIRVTIISAREVSAPEGETPIEWNLITTIEVDSIETAILCIKAYATRWLIERYHYVLKSGCQVEDLQLESPEGLERAIATYCIVAWRLMYITYLARTEPDAPCTKIFSDDEWKALYCYVTAQTVLPTSPPSLQHTILLIARLGGFLARKGDGIPGLKVIWRGLRRLGDIVKMYKIFT